MFSGGPDSRGRGEKEEEEGEKQGGCHQVQEQKEGEDHPPCQGERGARGPKQQPQGRDFEARGRKAQADGGPVGPQAELCQKAQAGAWGAPAPAAPATAPAAAAATAEPTEHHLSRARPARLPRGRRQADRRLPQPDGRALHGPRPADDGGGRQGPLPPAAGRQGGGEGRGGAAAGAGRRRRPEADVQVMQLSRHDNGDGCREPDGAVFFR